MSKYLVLFNSRPHTPLLPDPKDAHPFQDEPILGPFDTLREAYDAIVEDAESCFESSDSQIFDDHSEYASRAIVVQVIDAVRPVPMIRTSWRLDNISMEAEDDRPTDN